MTGVAQVGAQTMLNALTKVAVPVVSGSAPTWVPGLYWIDSGNAYAVKEWNGVAWVVAQANGYLALLTADPSGSVNISDLTEVTTTGYSRVAVAFNAATSAIPSIATNSSLITFGPFTANMSLQAQWLAFVSVSTGTVGLLLDMWTMDQPQQVNATQTIDIAAGALSLTDQ